MAGSWWRDFLTVRDFRAFELVNSLRLPLSLSAFKLLITLAGTGSAAVGGSLFAVLLALLRDTVFRDQRELAWQIFSIATLYGSAALIGAELLTQRRLAVSANPHLRLFRDLDVPVGHVALRYGVLPAAFRVLPLLASTVIFLAVFGPGDGTRVITYAWLLPVAVFAGSVACFFSARNAKQAPFLPSRVWRQFASCSVVGLVLGFITTATLRGDARLPAPPTALAPATAAALVFFALVIAVFTVVQLRQAEYSTMLLAQPVSLSSTLPPRLLVAALLGDLRASPHGMLVGVYYFMTVTIAGILVGAAPLLPVPALRHVGPGDLLRAVNGSTWLLSACIIGVAFERIGPTAKLFHARYALENGLSAALVVASMFGAYFSLAAPIGGFVMFAGWLVTGTFFASPLAIALIVAAAETVAECLISPRPNTDGTKSVDISSSILGYALMSPCSAVLFLDPAVAEPLVFLYAAVLTSGALLCLRLRLTRLSSNSARSPRDMIVQTRSSKT